METFQRARLQQRGTPRDVADLLKQMPDTPQGMDVNSLPTQSKSIEAREVLPRRPDAPLPSNAITWEQERALATGYGDAKTIAAAASAAGDSVNSKMPQHFRPPPLKGNGNRIKSLDGPPRHLRRTFQDLRSAQRDELARQANSMFGTKEAFEQSSRKAKDFLKQLNHHRGDRDSNDNEDGEGLLSKSDGHRPTRGAGSAEQLSIAASNLLSSSSSSSPTTAISGPKSPSPRRPPSEGRRHLGQRRLGKIEVDVDAAFPPPPRGKVSPLPEGTNVRGIFRSAIDESPVTSPTGSPNTRRRKPRMQLAGSHALLPNMVGDGGGSDTISSLREGGGGGGGHARLKSVASLPNFGASSQADPSKFRLTDSREAACHSPPSAPRGMSLDMGRDAAREGDSNKRPSKEPTYFTFDMVGGQPQAQQASNADLSFEQSMMAYRQQMLQESLWQQQMMQQYMLLQQQEQQKQQVKAAAALLQESAHTARSLQQHRKTNGYSDDASSGRQQPFRSARFVAEASSHAHEDVLETKRSITGRRQVPSAVQLVVQLSDLRLRKPFKCAIVLRIAGDKSRSKGRPILVVDPVPRRVESLVASSSPTLEANRFAFKLASVPDTFAYEKIVLRLFRIDDQRREPAVAHLADIAGGLQKSAQLNGQSKIVSKLQFLHMETRNFEGSIAVAFSIIRSVV